MISYWGLMLWLIATLAMMLVVGCVWFVAYALWDLKWKVRSSIMWAVLFITFVTALWASAHLGIRLLG